MAIFRPQRATTGIPYGILETPGKLYIEGQAHDATTLAPIFNDTTVMGNSIPSVGRGASPLFPMRAKQYHVANHPANMGATIVNDTTYFDNNQGIASNVKVMSSKADTLAISQTVWGSNIVPATLVNSKTGNQISTYPLIVTSQADGHSVIFYESSTSLFSFTQHTTQQGINGSGSGYPNFRVFSTNTNTGAHTNIMIGNTANSYTSYGSIVHESPSDFFMLVTAGNNTAVSATTTMHTVSKTGVLTNFNMPARTNNIASYRPTKAVAVSDTKRIVYLPEVTSNSTGDLFKFSTYEINTAAATTAPVHVQVTPTNATTMAGTVLNNSNMLYRAWAFVENDFIYINVGCFQPTVTAVAIETNYIHTYRAPLSDPKNISYVTSTQMHPSQRANGAFPIDDDGKSLVIPYVGLGLDFFVWNSGSQSYIRSNSALMDTSYMMVDQTGRLWAVDTSNNLHVFSQTISNSIKVGFSDANLRYTGSVINSNLVVSAYNFKGERVANNVTLQIDSASATFADNTTTTTITTSATGDTLVPVKITGAGYVRVVSNLAI